MTEQPNYDIPGQLYENTEATEPESEPPTKPTAYQPFKW